MSIPIQVLLVEDNPADADLACEALNASQLHLELSVVMDGVQVAEFLYRRGNYAHAPRPDLILLDLNLPRKDGREVLAEIKMDSALRCIPVVILTSSQAERDVVETYSLGANSYVIKPVDLKTFRTIVRTVEAFWFTVATLPPKDTSMPK